MLTRMGTGVILSCAGCGKTYRLRPSAETRRACPDCGEALGPADAPPKAGAPPDPTPRVRRGVPEDSDTRQQANRAVATAKRNLLMIRWGLLGPAFLCGVLFVLLLAGGREGSGLLTVLLGSVALAAILAAIFVLRQPLLATLLNALLATPMGVLSVVSLLHGGGLAAALTLMLVAAFWMAVPMALSTQRIMRRYPDLYAARAMRGESTGRHAEEARREAARRLKRTFLIGAAVLVVLVGPPVLLVALRSGSHGTEPVEIAPPGRPFEPAEEAWRTAWNADRVADVKGHLAASELPRRGALLDRLIKKHAWTPLPRVTSPRIESSGEHRRIVHYDVEGRAEPVNVFWEWEAPRWVVVNWDLPRS